MPDAGGNFKGIRVPALPWERDEGYPETESCEGDGYHDIVDPDNGGVLGPRPCRGCPDCREVA